MPPPPVPLTQLLTPLLCFKGQKLAVNQEHLECSRNSNMAKKSGEWMDDKALKGNLHTHSHNKVFYRYIFVLRVNTSRRIKHWCLSSQ